MSRGLSLQLPGQCWCGHGPTYQSCCEPIVSGQRPAATAEELMRSRYSAFAVGDNRYLLESWDPNTRPTSITISPGQRWTQLQIVASSAGGSRDKFGTVEFIAHYVDGSAPGILRERSLFRRHQGQWVYVDAEP